MLLSQELESKVFSFLVGEEGRLVLLKVFVLDSNVVQRDNHHGVP